VRDPAFDVIFDSQRIFRSLLDAMANPGRIITLPKIGIEITAANMYPLLLLMTLLDHEVSFCVLDNGAQTQVIEYLKTNTGSKESRLENSDFILVYGGSSHGLIQSARVGTLEYPDESATVIYDIDSIGDDGGDVLLELSGPGIADKRRIGASGIEQNEIEDVLAMRDYPLGLDLIFSDRAGRIACIPRSTTMGVL
jgi:alpha-D-ribose 1-methylphosphonate 5-triphosphate synthase subunit PhnH